LKTITSRFFPRI